MNLKELKDKTANLTNFKTFKFICKQENLVGAVISKLPQEWKNYWFVQKAIKVNGDKYDYSITVYTNTRTKLDIICKEHGKFEQLPNHHLNGKQCRKCSMEIVYDNQRLSSEEFIEKAVKVHGNKYGYL